MSDGNYPREYSNLLYTLGSKGYTQVAMMQASISMAAANLTDEAALENLLGAIPNNQQLREALKPGFAGSADIYHAQTRTVRYLRADGKLAVCFILTDVSQPEAQAVGAALEKVKIADLGLQSFAAVVRSILQAEIGRVN
jgi:hypothetical protein